MKRYTKYKNFLTVAISACIVCILFLIGPLLEVLNSAIYEEYFRIKNSLTNDSHPTKIILIDIDDTSLKDIGAFPFPRSIYARSLDILESFSPAVIGMDILFLDPSGNEEEDDIFIQTIQSYNNIVLGSAITADKTIEKPFFETSSGYLPPRVNGGNNSVYSFFPSFTDRDGMRHEHFTIQLLRKYYYYFSEDEGILNTGTYNGKFYNFSEDISYPLSEKQSTDILINFSNPNTFSRISFSDTLSRKSIEDTGIDISDALIVIGPAAEGFGDYFYTPNGREYGMNIHGHILSTLIQKKYISYFESKSEWMLIFLLLIVSVYVNLSSSRWALILGNISIIGIFWIIIPAFLILVSNVVLGFPAQIIFSLILAFSSANIVKYIIESMNKKKLGAALSEYVGSSIADEILLEHGKVNLDGEKREVVCFFSDIEGFTTLSELLDPESLVSFLRDYLSEMTNITMERGGHIDKFEGDAIMALWGAFTTYTPEDCVKACETALVQQKKIYSISEKYEKILQNPLRVRIGIHEGDAIIGNIGAIGKKMEFTALGDTVNLSSRLEGVNKYYGTYICVSHQVHEVTKDVFAYRFLDEIRVQGKQESLKIYELLGHKKDLSEEEFEHYMGFARALGQYRKGNFEEAADMFLTLSEDGDIPSGVFLDRCRTYIKIPPNNWDGIWNMEGK